MKKFKFMSVTIISLFFVFQLIGNADAQSETTTLAKSRYSDPNDYFKIVPLSRL